MTTVYSVNDILTDFFEITNFDNYVSQCVRVCAVTYLNSNNTQCISIHCVYHNKANFCNSHVTSTNTDTLRTELLQLTFPHKALRLLRHLAEWTVIANTNCIALSKDGRTLDAQYRCAPTHANIVCELTHNLLETVCRPYLRTVGKRSTKKTSETLMD
jgi:hypothetical protein